MPGEKTEEATPRRRQESRRRGQVGRSQDLSGMVVLFGAIVLLRLFGPRMADQVMALMSGAFNHIGETELTPQSVTGSDTHVMLLAFEILLPLLLGMVLFAIAANVFQTGVLFTVHPLKPQLTRISPLAGAKRILSRQSLVTLVRNLAKLLIVGAVLALVLRGQLNDFLALGSGPLRSGASRFADLTFQVLVIGGAVLVLLGLVDLFFQRRLHAQQIRMSKDEVKDEFRQTEGDPGIKGRVRQMRRDFFNRMMASVPEADVVVTNPTHLAVALKYDPLSHEAPVVVAKGERLIAERIKQIAEQHDIPVWEDKPLARALYAGSAIGKPIPAHLFQAVAEVLAFIFRLRAGLPARPPEPRSELALGT